MCYAWKTFSKRNIEICRLRRRGKFTYKQLGKIFNISPSRVQQICELSLKKSRCITIFKKQGIDINTTKVTCCIYIDPIYQ